MKIIDEGFFLYSSKFGENSEILYILTKNYGLIKGLSKISLKKKTNLVNLDSIKVTWSAKNKDALGYINYEQIKSNNLENYFFTNLKASASELCIKFLPLWEKNINIYNDILEFSYISKSDKYFLIGKYINWEINFLSHLGYGLNIRECSISNDYKEAFFLSPKTGNAVCYEVGKKYSKKLFTIPLCIKDNFAKDHYDDYLEALEITQYFLCKILENKRIKFIFRNQIFSFLKDR